MKCPVCSDPLQLSNDEVFWIREVCDADKRVKLVTDEAKKWFAMRTIADAMIIYELKLEMAGERA